MAPDTPRTFLPGADPESQTELAAGRAISEDRDPQGRLSGWRGMVFEAAIRQGPSFVILLLLLSGLWHFGSYFVHEGLPTHLRQIQQGYEQIQKSHSSEIDRLVTAFERDQILIRDTHDLLEEAIVELKRNRSAGER